MDFANLKSLTVPEGEVKEIYSGDVLLWKGGYTNLVPLSTEADGVTIYNGGLGYKVGYRVRSGGVEGAHSGSACYGFIPCKAGDTIRIYSTQAITAGGSSPALNVFDASKNNLGQMAYNNGYGILAGYIWPNKVTTDANGIISFTIPTTITDADKIEFIRVSLYFGVGGVDTGAAGTIITVNEEIEL